MHGKFQNGDQLCSSSLCQCVKCNLAPTRFIHLSSHLQFSLASKCDHSAQGNTGSFIAHALIMMQWIFFRGGWWPLDLWTNFSLNPSDLVDKYFALWPTGESHRWMKEGDNDQSRMKIKKEALSNGVDSTKSEFWIQFCQYAEAREKKTTTTTN